MENNPIWKEYRENGITYYITEEEEVWKLKRENKHSILFGTIDFNPYRLVDIPPFQMFKEKEDEK